MKSFVASAVLIATFSRGGMALDSFFTPFQNPPTYGDYGSVSATGANGGYNYGGNGANGGGISINRFQGGGPVNANGANGGQNHYGNGANGGNIGIGRREENSEDSASLYYPGWNYPSYAANGAITTSGANGGYNYDGNSANGGGIWINKREDDFILPWGWNSAWNSWYRPITYPASGSISATGANGGYNYNGDGANGGEIAINRRDDDCFFFRRRRCAQRTRPANGPISTTGANGGYNYGGNGANGGAISIGK